MAQSGSEDDAVDSSAAAEKRDGVAQATGVLVAQKGLNTETAFERLATEAADSARPVVDVAREILEQGGL